MLLIKRWQKKTHEYGEVVLRPHTFDVVVSPQITIEESGFTNSKIIGKKHILIKGIPSESDS